MPGARATAPGTRGAAPTRPSAPARPASPARPFTRPGQRRGAGGPSGAPHGARARVGRVGERAAESRTHFVFLVVGLLGGALLCLLLINTVLATGSFQITGLQQSNVTLAQRDQDLQARIAAEKSPAGLARRARQLGMVEPPLLHFLNLASGRIKSQRPKAPGVPLAHGSTP